ncbi:MAG: T9SS type A sorting domain-containing protein [Chitinophagaceae bacterium]|nr:T9SS type A sorting domain-containing protein [Chitinophagaceae bacterium]
MRKVYLIFFLFFQTIAAYSQINLTSGSPSYSQDFDAMGATLNLPANWRMAASTSTPTWAAAVTTLTQQASTGSPIAGGTYNWGSIATERAVGAMTSGGFPSPNSPLCFFSNAGASNITDLAISYDAERYRTNSAVASIEFYYSLNGSTWISVSAGDVAAASFPTGISAYQFSPPITTVNVTGINITALSIAPGSNFYLRWNINTTGANSQGIGIDNVTLTATFAPPNTVTTGAVAATPFALPNCATPGAGTVAFTSTDVFGAGNVFTAQLSDEVGSFATPVFLGSISGLPAEGTAPSGVIPIVIPAGTVSSSAYRIRVIGSTPAVTGTSSSAFQIIQLGACSSSQTDSYRSFQTGNWANLTTWESQSPDNATWISATKIPSSLSNNIFIRNGHTVTVTSSITVDQVEIQSGGILENVMVSLNSLTIANGSGDDIDIKSGGIYLVTSGQTYANHITINSGATINIEGGGTIQIGNGSTVGGGCNAYGITSGSYVWDDASVFNWNSTTTPGIQTTFFPDALSVIPVFRFTSTPSFSMGGSSSTVVNGRLEATAPIAFTGASTKTFRNGIVNSASIDGFAGASLKFIINGTTAQLGGIGSLALPTAGLEIGSASGTTVTVSNNKVVTGNVSLLSTNTFVDLGTSNLTVTGNITGGTSTSYIRTASTGSLILNTVDVAGKTFPVGHSSYNPLLIQKGNDYNWTVNVNDGVIADPPNGVTGAVLLTWNITPSTNPPISGADITFQFNALTQTGASFNPPDLTEPVQAWHRKLGYWLAAGTPNTLTDIGSNLRTLKILNLTDFSPYALSRISLPLPLKLISFNAVKLNTSRSFITWELAACCSRDAKFEIQRSADGINFSTITTIAGSETNRFYNYHDNTLQKGINYYRLKGIDVDGKISYSKVVAIINDATGLLLTTVAPNPVQDNMTVSLSAAKAATVQFIISDIAGRPVKQWSASITEGNNSISINASGLAAGIYHLGAMTGDSKTVIRFVKQ